MTRVTDYNNFKIDVFHMNATISECRVWSLDPLNSKKFSSNSRDNQTMTCMRDSIVFPFRKPSADLIMNINVIVSVMFLIFKTEVPMSMQVHIATHPCAFSHPACAPMLLHLCMSTGAHAWEQAHTHTICAPICPPQELA